MDEAIKNFNTQFAFTPEIINNEKLNKYASYIVYGMGGSHLSAGLVKVYDPQIDIQEHSDYGLTSLPDEYQKRALHIMSSYSGNTEEVLDNFDAVLEKGYHVAVIAVGGQLIDKAKKANVPYLILPDTGIQPRSALGFSIRAMFEFIGHDKAINELGELEHKLEPDLFEQQGSNIAISIKNKVPIIYSSTVNKPIAYNWKIKFNETGKIPAFYNVLPELNHNEMTGFDVKETSALLSERMHFIFLEDTSDHIKIQKRMHVLKKLYEDRGFGVTVLKTESTNKFKKMFESLILADWSAFYTAKLYNLEPQQVPMVEEFKKLIV